MKTLQKTKRAIADIQMKLEPVLKKLKRNDFGGGDNNHNNNILSQAQASVALSIGMMRYMGARLRGLDQGRSKDDPLRQELNKMKEVLAEIKKRQGIIVAKDNKQVETIDDKSKTTMASNSKAGVATAVEPTMPIHPPKFRGKDSEKRKSMTEPTEFPDPTSINSKSQFHNPRII
jgi:hypothetical protein